MGITDFLGDYWWVILLGGFVVFVVGSGCPLPHDRTGRHSRDRLSCGLPVLGELVRFTIVERFCRILGSMVRAGVQVPDAMAVASGSTNNVIYQEALEGAREAMLRGEGMAGPIAATGLFPGGVCQMIRVGEDTGTLDDQLETAADFYGKEVEYKLEKLTALFEPLMILVVGLIVGLRRDRARVGDVRHLQPGEGALTCALASRCRRSRGRVLAHRGARRARHPRRRDRRDHRRRSGRRSSRPTCTGRA